MFRPHFELVQRVTTALKTSPGLGPQQALAVLRAHAEDLRATYAVRSLALFGSVARGETERCSDVDLLVEFAKPIGLLHLSRTARHIEAILGVPVDLVVKRAVLPELREAILKDAVDVFSAKHMRNQIVHGYDRIDPEIVWTVVQEALPPIVPYLERILSEVSDYT